MIPDSGGSKLFILCSQSLGDHKFESQTVARSPKEQDWSCCLGKEGWYTLKFEKMRLADFSLGGIMP